MSWSTILGLAGKFFVDLLAKLVTDWRRDEALKEAGAAEADAKASKAAAEAERRAAAIPRASEDETIDALDRGKF